QERKLASVEKTVAAVNRILEVSTQGSVVVVLFRPQVKQIVAAPQGGLRKCKWNRLAARFGCRARCDVGVSGEAGGNSAGSQPEHPMIVPAGRSECACNARSDVCRHIETL